MGPGPDRIGDYLLFPPFATGGAATVHLGRLVRGVGFERLVVVKRLHSTLASEPGAVDRLLREARLASRVRSPYVLPTLDVVKDDRELCLVIDFVLGVTLGELLERAAERKRPLDPAVVVAIAGQVLRGLHAAHEATGEDGAPLELVHRDISPQNVIVGADGLARILDFGVAKALGHKDLTASSEIRGTLAYMAPEQLRSGIRVTRQVDIHAVGVLLWEALVGARLRPIADVDALVAAFAEEPPAPRTRNLALPPALDAVVLRALRRAPAERFPTAQAMLAELEAAVRPAPTEAVVEALELHAFDELDRMRELVARCERADSGTSKSPERALPKSGDVVAGKYRLGELLGAGGMGLVFAATNELLGTSLAVKIVRSDRYEEDVPRMLREARAAQKLTSAHVVRVLDAGTAPGYAYLAMERLEGDDLRDHLVTHRRLPIAEAVLYALHACDALAEAHAFGIVHRDLKPANLFLAHSNDGRPIVKVLDFGIAKETRGGEEDDSARSLTATTAVLGSPAYMAPEQIRSSKSVDARADVWGLAVVLYQLLTGAYPFTGETTPGTLASISADPWIPIRSVRPDVPVGLSSALERCFAKNPAERTPSMPALAAELLPFAPPGYTLTERLRPALVAPLPRAGGAVAGSRLALGAAALTVALAGLVGVGLAVRGRAATRRAPGALAIAAASATTVASTADAPPSAPAPPPPAPSSTAFANVPHSAPSPASWATGRRAGLRPRPPSTPPPTHEPTEPPASATPPRPSPKPDPTADYR